MIENRFQEAIIEYLGKDFVNLNDGDAEFALDHLGPSESNSEMARWFYERGIKDQ